MKKLLVIFGGKSTEHDVSIITGVLALNSVNPNSYEATGIYVSKSGEWYSGEQLKSLDFFKNPDFKRLKRVALLCGDDILYEINGKKLKPTGHVAVALSCMHGINGEDGTVIGTLKCSGIAVASPDTFTSAVAIDKERTKLLLSALSVPFVDYVSVERDEFYGDREKTAALCSDEVGFPLIVKPARLGSSIGVEKVDCAADLDRALVNAFVFDNKVLCEKYVRGARDVNVAAYYADGKLTVSGLEEAVTSHDLLTFADKYGGAKGGMQSSVRVKLNLEKDKEGLIKDYCARIYLKLGFRGLVRFDFLLDGSRVFLNEINAVPGSLAYYFFCDKISDFSNLIDKVCAQAELDARRENRLVTEFKSSVLSGDFSSAKK